jgi:hypothetical protein
MRIYQPGKTLDTDQLRRSATPARRPHAAARGSGSVPRSPGPPLAAPLTEAPLTEEMKARPGADFSRVPVHTDDAGEDTLARQPSIGNAAVSRMPEQARHQHGAGGGHQQTAPDPVQRSAVRDVLSRPGQPLASPLKEEMEARLRADFSRVRVHTDDAARASAAAVGARAYTSGNHVVIGPGAADRRTLAHELTHVIQHRQGPVTGTDDGSGLRLSDPSGRFERAAEAAAEGAVHGTLQRPGNAGEAPSAPSVAGGRLIVSRLMDAGKLQDKTKPLIPLIGRRSESIGSITLALAAYHAIPIGEYQGRVDGLVRLVLTCDAYLAGRDLAALPAETSVAPASAAGSPARPTAQPVAAPAEGLLSLLQRHARSVRLLREQAQREQQAFARLAKGEAAGSPLDRFRAYAQAQEVFLKAVADFGHDDFDHVLGQVDLPRLLLAAVVEVRKKPDEMAALLSEDVQMLHAMVAEPGLPRVTYDVLTEVLANETRIHFEQSAPGTMLSKPGVPEKYTVKHMLDQPLGRAERLGSLTH